MYMYNLYVLTNIFVKTIKYICIFKDGSICTKREKSNKSEINMK